jgi:FAD/FMN-containing dehydrogenase
MSDQIIDMAVILASGNIRRVEFDDPEFPAFATNLGSLGIIYSITIQCVDNYAIDTEARSNKWGDVKTQLLDFLNVNPLTQFSVNPNTLKTTIMLRKISTDINEESTAFLEKPTESRPKGFSVRLLKKAVSKDGRTLDKYYKPIAVNLPMEFYTMIEIAIPYKKIIKAIDDILKLCSSHKTFGFNCNGDISVRFTGSDYNAWLSPASGRISAWIQVRMNMPNNKINKFNQDLEDLLLYKYAGRPTWTTSKFIDHYKSRLLYGLSLEYFRRIRDRFDPHKIFSNEFMQKILD